MKTAIIIAGGKATRLGNLSKDTPKGLIKIGRKPVLEHQIELLRQYGIREIWILLGYLGEQIKEYFKDGKKWNVSIKYLQEKSPLGTAGALKNLEKEMKREKDDFLVLSGDVMLDMDIKRLIVWNKKKGKKVGTIIVHPNDHPKDSDLVEIDKEGRISSFLKRPHPQGSNFRNLSIASGYIFSSDIFKYITKRKKCDIEKDIFPLVLKSKGKLFAYNTPEYIKDMGTPKRLKEVRQDYNSGKIKKLNLKNKRKAVFLDRDGVINRQVDDLSKIKDFKLYNFSAKAIKKINGSDYLTIIVTNQPAIAKGFMKEEELTEMHKKLETEIGLKGAKIDAIYYCPHHPEKGFSGEVPELKIKCDCRKPGIGLIKRAAEDFNLDLSKSVLIGDSSFDAKTAENARIKFLGIKTGYSCRDGRYQTKQKSSLFKNLLEAVKEIC
ncbi:MAG: HAD-IIIA family hydrolase [bacterium]